MEEMRATFKPGDIVILDADVRSGSRVKVISQTPKKLFTRVGSLQSKYEWDVMTYRLTKINENEDCTTNS